MRRYLKKRSVLKTCHIYTMLESTAKKRHLSFHTPGHKIGKWDVTELSYSDNLSAPRGCIKAAETDVSALVGSHKSFLLTDGSTSGVLAMLHAAKSLGVKTIAVSERSHKSVFNGCALLGITPLLLPTSTKENIPLPITRYALSDFDGVLAAADALLLTSPDYYGNVADLAAVRAYCDKTKKLLLIDGAHGGHLRFEKEVYAGTYADMWVDGVHKSLPAFTQGALLSARDETTAEALGKAVDVFRTTSPSYPIMASVEYAVKYPRNEWLETAVADLKAADNRFYQNTDYTKLVAKFGKTAFDADAYLQSLGIYSEFCDGNVITFYLSPATTKRDFKRLCRALKKVFIAYPLQVKDGGVYENTDCIPTEQISGETEWVQVEESVGRICMADCGLFPPCTPLLRRGERITSEKAELLLRADNVFGVKENKIAVLKKTDGE